MLFAFVSSFLSPKIHVYYPVTVLLSSNSHSNKNVKTQNINFSMTRLTHNLTHQFDY